MLTNEISSDVRVTELSDGVRYKLPPRELGKLHWMGVAVLALGLALFAGLDSFFYTMLSLVLFNPRHATPWFFKLVFFLFLIPFFTPGLYLLRLGTLIFFHSHAEIILAGRKLRTVDRYGPVSWTRRYKNGHIEKLIVDSNKALSAIAVRGDAEANASNGKGKKRFVMAMAYNADLLLPIAQDLSHRLALGAAADTLRAGSTESSEGPPVEVGLVDPDVAGYAKSPPPASPDPNLPPVPKPPDSKAQLIEAPGLLQLVVPPIGFRGTPLFFTLFSLPFMAVGVMVLVASILGTHDKHGHAMPPVMTLLFPPAFGGVGGLIFCVGLNGIFRKAVFVSDGTSLVFSTKGPFGRTEKVWPTETVRDVRTGPSNTKVNDQPLPELQIFLAGTKNPVGVLTGRDEAELNWIADVLRRDVVRAV